VVVDREVVTVERARQEAVGRQEKMVEDLRRAELVKAYPEGHEMRVLIEGLHLDQTLGAVEEEIRTLRGALIHPRGT
jgi:hypothetical protein